MNFDERVYTRAFKKLLRIIEREGDAEGERLSPGYFKQLLKESETELRAQTISSGGLL